MLLHSYSMKLDRQGRFYVPSEMADLFLKTGKQPPVMTNSIESLTLYHYTLWEGLEKQISKLASSSIETRTFLRFFYSSAIECQTDPRHRISLPPSLRDYAHIDNRITLLSVGRRVHIISTEKWDSLKSEPNHPNLNKLLKSIERDMQFIGRPAINISKKQLSDLDFLLTKEFLYSKNIKARYFEEAVGEIFSSFGVGVIEITQPYKDGGVDLIIYIPKDEGYQLLYVECKAGENKATVSDLRELIGVIARDGVSLGLLISRSGFTEDAVCEANISKIKVEAIIAVKLAMWIESKLIQGPYYEKGRIKV